MVDREADERDSKRLSTRLKFAALRHPRRPWPFRAGRGRSDVHAWADVDE